MSSSLFLNHEHSSFDKDLYWETLGRECASIHFRLLFLADLFSARFAKAESPFKSCGFLKFQKSFDVLRRYLSNVLRISYPTSVRLINSVHAHTPIAIKDVFTDASIHKGVTKTMVVSEELKNLKIFKHFAKCITNEERGDIMRLVFDMENVVSGLMTHTLCWIPWSGGSACGKNELALCNARKACKRCIAVLPKLKLKIELIDKLLEMDE